MRTGAEIKLLANRPGRKTNAHPRQRQASRAFTLIELLVSMTILIIMTLIMTRIISDSSRAVDLGYQQAMMDGNARAFLDILLDDLNQAIAADDMEMRVVNDSLNTYDYYNSDTLLFYSLGGTTTHDSSFTPRLVEYRMREVDGEDYYVLVRGDQASDDLPHSTTRIFPLLDYVVQFRVRLFSLNNQGQLVETQSTSQLPQFADILLITASDKMHQRAMLFSGTNRRNYLQRMARRHFVQATFPMAEGRNAVYDYHSND